jgi:hypothetical protein
MLWSRLILKGFDRHGEPSVRVFRDGHLEVVFEFMPPSLWEMKAIDEARFGSELSAAIGVDVVAENTGFFIVSTPQPDTVDRIKAFVSTHRKTHGYTKS